MGLGGGLELVGGFLIMIGLFTRVTAFILSGEMAVAYFMAHAPQGHVLTPMLNEGEPAVLFCFVFLLLSVAGPGAWSLSRRA
jgi:putative oxidoreductase